MYNLKQPLTLIQIILIDKSLISSKDFKLDLEINFPKNCNFKNMIKY